MSARCDRPAIFALPGRRIEAPQDAALSLGEVLSLPRPLAGWDADERARLRALAESVSHQVAAQAVLVAMSQTDVKRRAYEDGRALLDDLLRAVAVETRARVRWEALEEQPNTGIVWHREVREKQQTAAITSNDQQRANLDQIKAAIPELLPTLSGTTITAKLEALGSGLRNRGFERGISAGSLKKRLRELGIPLSD